MTMNVGSSAKMNASGSQRSVQSVSASAARATGPGCSVILSAGYLNIGSHVRRCCGPRRKRGRTPFLEHERKRGTPPFPCERYMSTRLRRITVDRRQFLGGMAGATAGVLLGGAGVLRAARREGRVAGRRVKAVDGHAYCIGPEELDV